MIALRTARDELTFDEQTGRLVGLRARSRPDCELLATADDAPAFVLQYLQDGEYRVLDSRQARLAVTQAEGELCLTFSEVGGLDLSVALRVRVSPEDRFSRWTATVRNGTGLQLVDLQFPFVVAAPREGTAVLLPSVQGQLLEGEQVGGLPADGPRQWQFWPENGNSQHYPGRCFAQFVACYADGLGLYLACDDTAGNVKKLQVVRRPEGLRLGLSHVGDWPGGGGRPEPDKSVGRTDGGKDTPEPDRSVGHTSGGEGTPEPDRSVGRTEATERTLEYEVLLGSFEGDWYDAADLYRDWTLRQAWATPLTQRRDVPQWLLDSPPHITIRLQGYVDDGPAPPIEAFLPYEKCVPLLEQVAAAVDSPLVAVLMSWERGGPWVYPDCFPPVGGDASLANFCRLARERGWHVGSFCNGTRWVMKHLFNAYDGEAYFAEHQGAQGICRRPDGELWAENWDQSWRPSYLTCLGQQQTRRLARDFVRRLIGWGMESIQFFDQNCNASTFPCFSSAHDHPPLPGKWMAQAMADIIAAFHEAAAEAGEAEVIHSTEWPTNEVCLPLFQQSDLRISAPGSGAADFVPVYQYLYHECMLAHGMMSLGPEPYAVEARTAWEFVWGEMVGAVMTGDGTLLNRETWNWADWEPKVGSNENALRMLRVATALRRGAGRDFLVYGRMQRPAIVVTQTCEWEHEGRRHRTPAVAHCAWQSPDGRLAVALANWTTEQQPVALRDPRLGPAGLLTVCGETDVRETGRIVGGVLETLLPPLSCALLEAGGE